MDKIILNNIASVNVNKGTGAKLEGLEEESVRWIVQLNANNCAATNKVFKKRLKIFYKYCTLTLYQMIF
jgi:4-diphosphocytidyl-2C-methyl-D-erythritol kinase